MSVGAYSDGPLLLLMFAAYDALRRSGWREAAYAPIGKQIELIEVGSTGIHRGHRDEQRRFWITDDRDTWPSNPILWRELPA